MISEIENKKAELAKLCERNHIVKLALFGSVIRDDFGPDSDVDVLVEFEPGRTPGLGFFEIEAELSRMLGKKVDLNTPGFLGQYFRERILAEAKVFYEAA